MAKFTVWLPQGTVIPSTGLTTTGLTAGTCADDGYQELSGSAQQIAADYLQLTGQALHLNGVNKSVNANSSSYGGRLPKDTQPGLNAGASGSYFGPQQGNG